MDWLETKADKKIVFNKKTLTVNGLISSQEIKTITKTHNSEPVNHPEYNLKEEKEIVEYFTHLVDTKNYCQEVYERCRFRFDVFTKHPLFSKFWSRLNQVYNPDWRYNILLLQKDKKAVVIVSREEQGSDYPLLLSMQLSEG